MLSFGTIVYAMSFVLVLPLWMHIDETRDGPRIPVSHVAIAMGCVLLVDRLGLDLVEGVIAPHFTTVIHDAQGLVP
jgi:hypothetical protein